MKKIKPVEFIIAIVLPLLVGSIASYLTSNAMTAFNAMKKPDLAPPGILFPIVWTILYILMGISSYLLIQTSVKSESDKMKSRKKIAVLLYIIQLIFNFCWSILFFRLSLHWIAFIWLIALWIFILLYTIYSFKVNKLSSLLMIPYLAWVAFAGYLNVMIAILN